MCSLDLVNDIDNSLNIPCKLIIPESCNKILSPFQFKILSLNIRSLHKNFDALLVLLHRVGLEFDVILLTECWLNDTSIIENIAGYSAFASKHNINQNGGVVAYVREHWNVRVTEPDFLDACGLLLEIPDIITMVGIYRSPSFSSASNFLHSLDQILTSIKNKSAVVVAGDLNIDILDSGCPRSDPSDYLCMTAGYNLRPAITMPTRLHACLDHILVDSTLPALGLVCDTSFTDHCPTMVGLTIKNKKCNASPRNRLRTNFEGVARELEGVDWSSISNSTDVNEATEIFLQILNDAVKKNTHNTRISRTKFTIEPWMTPGLLRCARHRDHLHKLVRQHPTNDILRLSYSRYRNFYVDLVRKLKTQHERSEIESNKNNTKRMWKSILKIWNKNKKSNQAGDLLSLSDNPSDALRITNDFFATVGERLANSILTEIGHSEQSLAASVCTSNAPPKSFFLSPTDPGEVETMIRNLKNGSAPGLDGFSNELVKSIRDKISMPLTTIFNLSLSTGCFPDAWKIAAVTPIHKDGSKDCPTNYRPISLLSVFSKILEKLVNNRLVSFLEGLGLLSEKQFGFRRNRSTEDAVSLLVDQVSSTLEKRKKSIGVFLDLAKAFDTVSIPILLRKLEAMGVRGEALAWFRSYLTERGQLVKLGSHTSNVHQTTYGVPQGSILGPTLFIVYMNDIHSLSIPSAEIICYADDTAILFSGKSWEETFQSAERGMSTIHKWLQMNLLTLNTKKTKFICFHKTASTCPPPIDDIKIHACNQHIPSLDNACNCELIQKTMDIKYLGVVLDEKLNFSAQIKTLATRIRKVIGVMKKLRDVCSINILKTVYLAICQSLLNYCIGIWGCAAKTHLIALERAQRAVLKVMLKKPFRFPTNSLYLEARVLRVRQLYIVKGCLSSHKNILKSSDYQILLKKRVYKLPTPVVGSSFAKRFSAYAFPSLYNRALKFCDIKLSTLQQAKKELIEWLLTLDYNATESIITS